MDDVYRTWCCSRTVNHDPSTYPYDTHFENEYKDFPVPELEFEGRRAEWSPTRVEENMLRIEPPLRKGEAPPSPSDILSEYYVSIMRTDGGNILNEKRYILKPTSVADLFVQSGDSDGFVKCSISPYQSASIEGDHFVDNQVVFVGTPDPFTYAEDGSKVYTKAHELQYGNGICGVDEVWLKVEVVNLKGEKYLVPTIKFVRKVSSGSTLLDKVHDAAETIPDGAVTIVFSHRNLDNIAKYHILNRSSNLFYHGSLPRTFKQRPDQDNLFKFSDFKFRRTIGLEERYRILVDSEEHGILGYLREVNDYDAIWDDSFDHDIDHALLTSYSEAMAHIQKLCAQ